MNLGERIKQIRKARGLSAESIAKELEFLCPLFTDMRIHP